MISNLNLHHSRGCNRHINQQLILLLRQIRRSVFARSSGKASLLTTDVAQQDFFLLRPCQLANQARADSVHGIAPSVVFYLSART
jgi:hypothetical protein